MTGRNMRQGGGVGLAPDPDEIRFRQGKRSGPPGRGSTVTPRATSGTSPWVVLLLLLTMVALAGYGYWLWYWQQQEIEHLQKEVRQSRDQVSRYLAASGGLEAALAKADAAMQTTGSRMEERFSHHDSEIRKLWDLANKRNRKAIGDLQADQEKLEQGLADVRKQMAGAAALEPQLSQLLERTSQIEQQVARAGKQIESNSTSLGEFQGGQSASVSPEELEQLRQAIDQATLTYTLGLEALAEQVDESMAGGGGTDLEQRMDAVEEAIEAIDLSRVQLLDRMASLEKSVK